MNDFHDMDEVDRRIADALRAAAGQVDEHSLRPALSPRSTSLLPRRHIRWTAPVLAAAAVVAVVVGTVAVTSSTSSSSPRRIQPGSNLPDSQLPVSTTTSSPSVGVLPSFPSAATSVPSTQVRSVPAVATVPSAACPFADMLCKATIDRYYLPIWPFVTFSQAEGWRTKAAQAGSSPWHADAAATAENYVQNVLGFTDLTVFSPARSTSREAYIRAEFFTPNGDASVAATLHLVRYGTASDAPWEVVGTEDDPQYLTIDRPSYGSTSASPVTVGGTFTGVDGNLVVVVRDQSGTLVGSANSIPAGGLSTPWRTSVRFGSTVSGVYVAVVYAGGSLVQHAHFAIQGFYG